MHVEYGDDKKYHLIYSDQGIVRVMKMSEQQLGALISFAISRTWEKPE